MELQTTRADVPEWQEAVDLMEEVEPGLTNRSSATLHIGRSIPRHAQLQPIVFEYEMLLEWATSKGRADLVKQRAVSIITRCKKLLGKGE